MPWRGCISSMPRRSFADLRIEALPHDPLSQALRRLGEAIKEDRPQEGRDWRFDERISRLRCFVMHPQMMRVSAFFVPVIYDAPIKDDVNLMDVGPCSLGKSRSGKGSIAYQVKDGTITINSSAGAGTRPLPSTTTFSCTWCRTWPRKRANTTWPCIAGLWCASLGFASERLARVGLRADAPSRLYRVYRHRSRAARRRAC